MLSKLWDFIGQAWRTKHIDILFIEIFVMSQRLFKYNLSECLV